MRVSAAQEEKRVRDWGDGTLKASKVKCEVPKGPLARVSGRYGFEWE